MSVVQTQTKLTLNVPKLYRSNLSLKNERIPIVKHVITDEDVEQIDVI
jgi:hypothetical protein